MKAEPGRHVQVQIGVMHPVEPPEKRDHVNHHVLEINHQVEKNDPGGHFHRRRPLKIIEQAPAVLPGEMGGAHRRTPQQPPDQKHINTGEGKIDRQPPGFGVDGSVPRNQAFKNEHRPQHAQENRKPYLIDGHENSQ